MRPWFLIVALFGGCAFDGSTRFQSGAELVDGGVAADEDGASGQPDSAMQSPPADAAVAPTKVDSFSDGFSDSTIGTEWSVSTSPAGCTVVETGGRIQFSMDGTSASRCVLTTVDSYDLRDSAAVVDIPSITNFRPQMYVFLSVSKSEDDRAEFGFNDGSFYATVVAEAQEVFNGTSQYSPNPRYWRIRESAGQLYMESSLDLANWEIEFQRPLDFAVGSVKVAFGVATSGPMGGAIGISVPGYNP